MKNTGDIKRFSILEESSIAKGIRRVVGATAEAAEAVSICNMEDVLLLFYFFLFLVTNYMM